jgi:hypothetical protein
MGIERRKVWQCIGCGRIEDSRPCVGICRDEKAEYVLAADHDRAIAGLLKVVRTIALTTPHETECLRHWAALQRQARRALEALD